MPVTYTERIGNAAHGLRVVFDQIPRTGADAAVRHLGLWSRRSPTNMPYELGIQAMQLSRLIEGGQGLGSDPNGNALSAMAKGAGKIDRGTFDSLLAIGLSDLPSMASHQEGALWALVACIQRAPEMVSLGLVLALSTRGLEHVDDLRRRRVTDTLQQIAWFAPDKIGLVTLFQLQETGLRFKEDTEWVRSIGETFCSIASHTLHEIVAYQAIAYLWDLRSQVSQEGMKRLLVHCIKEAAGYIRHPSVQATIIEDLDRGGFFDNF